MFTIDLDRSLRQYTPEGYLKVPGVLTRTGIQEYRAFELQINDGDPMRVIRVYRPEDEVFDPESMSSFEGTPITVNHPPEGVTADNWRQHSVGVVNGIVRDGQYMKGMLTVFDKAAIKAIEDGKDELSNGYNTDYSFAPGVTPGGEQFDAVQRNIRGNHVAIVDAARCGSACRVSDSKPTGATTMPKKITVDGLPLEFEESAAVVIEKLVTDRDAARADAKTHKDAAELVTVAIAGLGDSSITSLDGLVKALKDARIEIVELKKDVMTPDQRDAMVESWAKMTADAKRLVPEIETKGKVCTAIRREVVAKLHTGDHKPAIDAVLAGAAVDAASDDQIKTAFNVLAATAQTTPANDSAANDPLAGALVKDGKEGSDKGAELGGRDAYIARNANAWQNK